MIEIQWHLGYEFFMLSNLFLGMALLGAEWVLYLLLILSVLSIAIIIERLRFYREARSGLETFRESIRKEVSQSQWDRARQIAVERAQKNLRTSDMEASVARAVLELPNTAPPNSLEEGANDAIRRDKLSWEKNLAILATIGNNAPFVGLFGTVLGIIQAFHDLSQKTGTGVQTVTAGISEALIATAVGIFVAIPAVVAFNLFQRKVKSALTEAEALKSFLISQRGQG